MLRLKRQIFNFPAYYYIEALLQTSKTLKEHMKPHVLHSNKCNHPVPRNISQISNQVTTNTAITQGKQEKQLYPFIPRHIVTLGVLRSPSSESEADEQGSQSVPVLAPSSCFAPNAKSFACPSKHGALTTKKKSRGNAAQTSSWRPAFCFMCAPLFAFHLSSSHPIWKTWKKRQNMLSHPINVGSETVERKKKKCVITNTHVHTCGHVRCASVFGA